MQAVALAGLLPSSAVFVHPGRGRLSAWANARPLAAAVHGTGLCLLALIEGESHNQGADRPLLKSGAAAPAVAVEGAPQQGGKRADTQPRGSQAGQGPMRPAPYFQRRDMERGRGG